MTVGQLITLLSKFDSSLEVEIDPDGESRWFTDNLEAKETFYNTISNRFLSLTL